MTIANKSFLAPDNLNTYAVKDKKYTKTAIPVTIRRFGPSGSLNKKKSARENTMAVTARIRNEIFFDSKFIHSLY